MPKVLIVEDEPDILKILAQRLKTSGYDVIEAVNGKEGAEMAASEHPDVIIMDLQMPKMSGGDAIRELRKSEETKNIPVLILTGVGILMDTAEEKGNLTIDGQDYLTLGKPFEFETLVSMLNYLQEKE